MSQRQRARSLKSFITWPCWCHGRSYFRRLGKPTVQKDLAGWSWATRADTVHACITWPWMAGMEAAWRPLSEADLATACAGVHHVSSKFSSVAQWCPALCDPMDCSTPGLPVHYQLLELAQTHVHWVSDAIQPSHPLSFPSSAFNFSQRQDLFQWVSFSHQVTKVLEFQLQHQSFQRILRTDLL